MTAPVPARWLTDHAHLLPERGRALDVACGRGRHALWLAARGLQTHAVDRDADTVAFVRAEAARLQVPVMADVLDLETGHAQLPTDTYDAIVVVHYLHRALFPTLVAAVRHGGLLIYETFTVAQARRGKPTNPDFLLQPGELLRLVAPLDVLDAREGEYEGRDVASVVARRT
jgi:SAM-dependent methyltransferase